LVLPVLLVASACGPGGGDTAAARRNDSTQHAATAPQERDTAQARQAVLRLEEELFQSYARGDTAPAARILAEDYMGITGDGNRETKAQAIAALRRDSTTASTATLDSIRIDSTTVQVYGNAAVAQSSGTFQVHNGRQSATVGLRNTDVFAWRDGRWQIVATHLSKVAPPQGRARTP
jgi:hypothetical protein